MKSITIDGIARTSTGKRETRELRKKGQIPCSVYGGSENLNFYAPAPAFKNLVYTPDVYTATIKVDGKEMNAVMQDLQFDPITDELRHIDFLELNPDKKVTLELPVRLEGIAVGIKEGGKVNLRMKKLKVRMYPKNLIEHITIQVAHLDVGKSIRIGELQVEGIEFLNAPHIPVVSVLIPRVVKEEVPAAAAATAAAPGATPVAGATPAAGAAPAAEKGAEKKEEKGKEKSKDKEKKK